ncbi:hypothetical protein [Sulfuricurvum sp.]|uniref:hypothetical protein n=1 Tax=Sulfuricurvum sp. TaxID=2025608 RepID=UPI0026216749|nr:hypothetical protein [Sulfuricurvum sp.]MDD2267647.1 hypothetical protein [Sulfuricurvum sp.]MDD2784767.1 hypothetical protein [Sulfuricurvum sp.]
MPLSATVSQSDSVYKRCSQFIPSVAYWHEIYFGINFPYGYPVGQLQQEANCKFVMSKDGYGSVGAAQITPSVWAKALPNVDFWSIDGSSKGQAFINKDAWKQASIKRLWVMFQIYNGGGLVNKEIKRAGGINNWEAAKAQCRRGVTHYKWGDISNCEINYDYSVKVYKYGGQYGNITESSQYRYW